MKTTSSSEVVLLARAAGYDSVFVDLEHSTLSTHDASTLCTTALLAGVTPFVRVPHDCGSGFVQRVLDGGAVGVIYPHLNTAGKKVAYVQQFMHMLILVSQMKLGKLLQSRSSPRWGPVR